MSCSTDNIGASRDRLKILFICDYYGENMGAIGVCIKKLTNCLDKRDYEIYVVSRKRRDEKKEEITKNVFIYRYSNGVYNNLISYARNKQNTIIGKIVFLMTRLMGIRLIVFLPLFPIRDPLLLRRCCRITQKLHREIGFDIVIGAYNPIEAVLAASKIKKKHNTRVCTYFLDTLSDEPPYRFLSREFINKQGRKYEEMIFRSSDLILNMLCHEKNFLQIDYNKYREKMKTVDFPLLEKHKTNYLYNNERISKDSISAVYTGIVRISLMQYIIEVFEEVNNVKIHIYSSSILPNMHSNILVVHGEVSHDEALVAQNNADVLVCMGNKDSAYVPSKIFEYMSTGKKIIHFCYNDKDSCIGYFSRYRNALVVNLENSVEENTLQIRRFIEEEADIIPFDELKDTFPLNLPSYTVDVILDALVDKTSK
ncbi:MAG: hypothetical protein FWH57_02595 [Oscillospiraceae bacterium]|nr:hypothetical protein [Oscillospiraceae bacterium]